VFINKDRARGTSKYFYIPWSQLNSKMTRENKKYVHGISGTHKYKNIYISE
jgi:hypothetical protein